MTDTTTTATDTSEEVYMPSGGDGGRVEDVSFETLAVSAFIFGIFAIVAAIFAIGMSARAVEVANNGGGGGGTEASAGGGGGGGAASVDVAMTEFRVRPIRHQGGRERQDRPHRRSSDGTQLLG